MLYEPIQVEVPEWGLSVVLRPPTLADIRATRQASDDDDEDAVDAVTDGNIALLCRISTPPLDAARIVNELPVQRVRLLLQAVAEVSGVASADSFRPADDVR